MPKKNQKREERMALLVRLPRDTVEFLRTQATKYGNSQNAELIRTIRLRMEAEATR